MGSMLLVERTQLIAIFYLEHQQWREKILNMPDRLTLIKYPYAMISISLFTYILAVQLPASERTTWKNGKKYCAAMGN